MSEQSYHDDDFDAMPGRGLKARWVLTATLRLETAGHFGGQGDSALDMPVLRCARTGQPLLPGTSLAGALRAYLLDLLVGYGRVSNDSLDRCDGLRSIDKNDESSLFGGARTDVNGTQSPLIVFDSLGTLPSGFACTEVRDGVMIETRTGLAADQKKFDYEVLPPGTTFAIRLDLLVPDRSKEENLLSLLCTSLEGLSNGDIRIGLRRSRGLGELACSGWTARRYDLAAREGWLNWIGSDHQQLPDPASQKSIREAVQAVGPPDLILQDFCDQRKRVVIDAEAVILGDLLIRSPNAQADGPDVMHLTSGGQPVVTGTSLTGVIRAQALRIARLVHGLNRPDAEKRWITPIFGPREEGIRNPAHQPQGARLRVAEGPIANGYSQRVTRVAIDRFTQGVVPTALFEEQPHVGGTVQLRFEIRNPLDGELGLLLLVLKDLLTGQLPIGGASSVGRGVLIGRRLSVEGIGISSPIEVTFNEAEARCGRVPTCAELNGLVEQFAQSTTVVIGREGTPG